MPFTSKRQARAAFAGVLPGFNKERAEEWARQTDFSELPERAPAEKGKRTLWTKEAAMTPGRLAILHVLKYASLGPAAVNGRMVGRLRGMMSRNALKAPGYAASTQAMNPSRGLASAMNVMKPH